MCMFCFQIAAGATEVAIFAAASESFSQKNINCSIEESIQRFVPICEAANLKNVKIRGYVSTVVGCPYAGIVNPCAVAKVTESLLSLGCYEISLGDTIGVGTPGSISRMLKEVLHVAKCDQLAIHCHDTYGQALSNILTSLDFGMINMIVELFVNNNYVFSYRNLCGRLVSVRIRRMPICKRCVW